MYARLNYWRDERWTRRSSVPRVHHSCSYNTGLGITAFGGVTTGNNNTAVGQSAGYGLYGGGATYAVVSGSFNSFFGCGAAPSTATQRSYMTVIGAQAAGVDASNSVTLGRLGTDVVYQGVSVIGASAVSGAGYTVSTLPAASSALKGARAFVTDATSPTFLGALTGGGSVVCPVFCNGSASVAGSCKLRPRMDAKP